MLSLQSAAKLLAAIATSSLPLVGQKAFASNYYVSPSGSNSNSGSLDRPFLTIDRAYSRVKGGDTIYVRGGTYSLSSQLLLSKKGTAASHINIFAYPGERPVLNFTSMAATGYFSGWPLRIKNGDYNHIRGLEILNGPEGGVAITDLSKGNILENLNVHHNGRLSQSEGKGIAIFGRSVTDTLLLNNDSHHNRDVTQRNADGFFNQGTRTIFRGNRAWRNSDDGYDTYDGAPAVFEGNYAFENGYDDNLRGTAGDGNGFKLGGQHAGQTSGGHTVTNNVAWKNKLNGFDENAATVPITINNNAAYNNGQANFYFVYSNLPHVICNNLGFGSGMNRASYGSVRSNSWNLSGSVGPSQFISVDDSEARGPRLPDGSLASESFLHLAASSSLIDRGVVVGLPYAGRAPDVGAFESGL